MTMNETRAKMIEEYTEIFEEEAKFPSSIARQAATDMIDNSWTYERAYRKYRKKLAQNASENAQNAI